MYPTLPQQKTYLTVWRLNFAGLNLRITLREHFVENNYSRIHSRSGVLHLKTPVRNCHFIGALYSATLLNCHFIGALYSATLLPTSTFSAFVYWIPGRSPDLRLIELAASANADITHDGTSWVNSPCGPGSSHFDYCPSSLLKCTNRAIKLAVARVCWNTAHVCRRTASVKIFVEIISQ